jgi:hypothetical protein
MFGSFRSFPSFFPGFGFGGILPSYIPYLVANGFGRCCGPFAPYPYLTSFPVVAPFPVFGPRFW